MSGTQSERFQTGAEKYARDRRLRSVFLNTPPTPSMVAELVESPPEWAEGWKIWTMLRVTISGVSKHKVAAFCGELGIMREERIRDLPRNKKLLLCESLRTFERIGGGIPGKRGGNFFPALVVPGVRARLAKQLIGAD